ncbi:MAG: orotidine-5'-phosphate decarboxylase [Pseudomonadota bacterium]
MKSPIIVALDRPDAASARALARALDPKLCRLKVGKELFTAAGPALLEELQGLGFEIFLDLKYHDIPNTVAGAVTSASTLGVWMVNVHASGGRRMLEAAASAAHSSMTPPKLIAVTVLTSMGLADLAEIYPVDSVEMLVGQLADLARHSGLDGVVCSAQEAPGLRTRCGDDFLLVTPGIRPAGTAHDDQTRIVTPAAALAKGSDYLVIGRPISRAEDPAAALQAIVESLD